MIVFLTLCYCGALALLVKFGVVKWTLWWKLSPLAWMWLLLVVFFIPMQWGAPAGPVNVYRGVVEIVPNVSGQVVEVQAKPLEPMKQGDVLFKIDPEPYDAEVRRLEAALKEAEQAAEMLPADLAAAKASVAQSQAALVYAKQQAQALESALAAAEAAVAKCEAQLALSQANWNRAMQTFRNNAISKEELDTSQRNLEAAKASVDEAKAQRDQAQIALDSQVGGVNTTVIQAEEALRAAQAAETKAQLAVESTINGENTTVSQLRAQLTTAKLNLDWTTVRAPSDGFVIGMSLRPGQRVAAVPVRSWMSFVPSESTTLIAGIPQYALRHVRPGQKTEVTLKLYPGRVLSATVDDVACINTQGQLQPSGTVAAAPGADQTAVPFVVRLRLDEDADVDVASLRGGAVGTAAIYTDKSRASHLIRRVMIRMEAWMNYIVPW